MVAADAAAIQNRSLGVTLILTSTSVPSGIQLPANQVECEGCGVGVR